MDNLAPVTDIDANEIPEGFSKAGGLEGTEQQEQAAQAKAILEQALTSDALARLGRIKLVKPAKVKQLEKTLVSMAMSGKLPGRINEGKLIEMLERGNNKPSGQQSGASSGGINIQRKKYAIDSDDEDDDDDDFM